MTPQKYGFVYDIKLQFIQVNERDPHALDTPIEAANYAKGMFDEDPTVEHFGVILLNRKHMPIGRHILTRGTAVSATVGVREIFRLVVLANATGLIVVHNHPSGDPKPSSADIAVTRRIKEGACALDVYLLDHVIIGDPVVTQNDPWYYSMREAGLI
jgi:DNA repair protein RadC